jgi:hypothetical protein
MTPARPRPIEREAQEVKGGRTFTPLLPRRWSPKWQQAGFVRMQGQPKALHPLTEHRHHPMRIVLSLKTDDKIIAVADYNVP